MSGLLRCACAIAAGAIWLAASIGLAQARDGGSSEKTVSVDGMERTYIVHIPPHVANPAPLVLLFHGGGGRPKGIERRAGMDELADQHGFVVVYPAGAPRDSGHGASWNINASESVSSADDVAFVRAILSEMDRALPIDHARVYATGVSMGGVFSYRLACEMSDRFAAIAPVSATMVEPSCHPANPVAVLHIHGSDDARIPLKGGRGDMTGGTRSWPAPQEGISSWSQLDGCGSAPTQSEDGGMSCKTYGACRASVEYCVINGGEHGWPEGVADRIWAFFEAHPKQAQ